MSANVSEIMLAMRAWESTAGEQRKNDAVVIVEKLKQAVAAGNIRMLDIDEPLMREYLDGGWDAIKTFSDYVRDRKERADAIEASYANAERVN